MKWIPPIRNIDGSITVSVTLTLEGDILEMENSILDAVNDMGCAATGEALKRFDTDGSPVMLNGIKLTSKKKIKIARDIKHLLEQRKLIAMFIKLQKEVVFFVLRKIRHVQFLRRPPNLHSSYHTKTHKAMQSRFVLI